VNLPNGAWACAALAALDARAIAKSARLLFAVATHVENSDMQWEPERKSILNHWGHGPVMAQGVPAVLELPAEALGRVFALDARGVRAGEVPAHVADGRIRIVFAPHYRTLWYILER